MSVSGGAEDRAGRLARRLGTLFREVHPAGRGPWSPEEAAEGAGVPVADVHRLGAGRAGADGADSALLPPLARHFRVPPAYLTAAEDAPEALVWQRTARRLRLLLAEVYPAGRGPWSPEEVAAASGVPVEDVRRMCAGVPPYGDSFADRLDQLCLRTSPAGGKPYSNREVGAAVGKSGQYIGNLRAGVNEPGLPAATDLARFFGVSVAYFVHGPVELVAGHFRVPPPYLTADDDSPAVREARDALRTLVALRDARVRAVVDRVLADRPGWSERRPERPEPPAEHP
jgi:hypothetical protein